MRSKIERDEKTVAGVKKYILLNKIKEPNEMRENIDYRNPSPSLPWEIISVPVVRPADGTTGLLLMCQWDINLN